MAKLPPSARRFDPLVLRRMAEQAGKPKLMRAVAIITEMIQAEPACEILLLTKATVLRALRD